MFKFQNTNDAGEKLKFLKNVRKQSIFTPAQDQMKIAEDLSQIYLFSSPVLFSRALELCIMLNSLYLALWATNFIYLVVTEFQNSPLLHFLCMIPIVFVLPCIGEIVKAASLLSAIAELNLNVIGTNLLALPTISHCRAGSVLEESEDRNQLLFELQEKIKARIEGVVADKKEVLSALFNEIDTDGSGSITKSELRHTLQALHLHFR
jgi:hypothetical protein